MDFLIRLIEFLIISVGLIILIIGFLSNQKAVRRFGVILIVIPTALFLLGVLYLGILDLIMISPEKSDFYGSYILAILQLLIMNTILKPLIPIIVMAKLR
jgi:hypothetical protein